MMEAVRTSETSVDNHSTRQYNPEDSSEHHTRRRENLKSHADINVGNMYHKVHTCLANQFEITNKKAGKALFMILNTAMTICSLTTDCKYAV
jgi:hypothetical protein